MEILAHTFESLCHTLKCRYGRGRGDAQAVMRQIYRRGSTRFREDPTLARHPDLARRLERAIDLTLPEVVDRQREGDTTKLVFRLADGERIESVLVPMAHYTTICVSSQVGCRMGCAFCQTSTLGLVRQLTVTEIASQVYWAKQVAGAPIRNVVFMGMGEPLDNFANLARAIAVISDQRGLDIAPRHITVSTVGLGDGIRRLADLNQPRLQLAVSLNAPNDGLRSRLMPVNRSTSLAQLQARLISYPLHPKNALLISYVLIPGINDGARHADQLAQFVAPLRAKVNLIPLNPCPQAPYRPPEVMELERFRDFLVERGVFVRRRAPKGQTIMAACGQLGVPMENAPLVMAPSGSDRTPLAPSQAPPLAADTDG
jgi:23S rRNA (adenine2503-C2)-methyltransferase